MTVSDIVKTVLEYFIQTVSDIVRKVSGQCKDDVKTILGQCQMLLRQYPDIVRIL